MYLVFHCQAAHVDNSQELMSKLMGCCACMPLQVESLAKQVKQLEETLRITTREYILGRCCSGGARVALARCDVQQLTHGTSDWQCCTDL
jgi:hypothetical protein